MLRRKWGEISDFRKTAKDLDCAIFRSVWLYTLEAVRVARKAIESNRPKCRAVQILRHLKFPSVPARGEPKSVQCLVQESGHNTWEARGNRKRTTLLVGAINMMAFQSIRLSKRSRPVNVESKRGNDSIQANHPNRSASTSAKLNTTWNRATCS